MSIVIRNDDTNFFATCETQHSPLAEINLSIDKLKSYDKWIITEKMSATPTVC